MRKAVKRCLFVIAAVGLAISLPVSINPSGVFSDSNALVKPESACAQGGDGCVQGDDDCCTGTDCSSWQNWG